MFEVIVIFIIPIMFVLARYIQITRLQPFKEYFSDGPNGDAAIYLLLIQFFRNFKDGDYDPRCLISKEGIYQPSLYEKIVGKFFSDRFLLAHSWFPNYLIFCCALLMFYITLLWEGYSGLFLVFGMAMFYFTPDHLIGDRWRIHFQSLQPRYLGAVFCSLFFLVCVAVNSSSDVRFWLLVLIAFLTFQVSVFSRQCLVFVGSLFSLLSADWFIAVAILSGFLLNCLFFGKKFVFDIKNELLYHQWYFNNYPTASKRYSGLKKFITKYLAFPIVQFPLYLSFWVALNISVANFLFRDEQTPEVSGNFENFSALFLSVAAVACITSFRKFACFGESWRYITFSCLFTLPLFWVKVQQDSVLQSVSIFVLILVLFICFCMNFHLRRKGRQTRFLENQTKSLQDIVSKCPLDNFDDVVWYGIPYSVSTIPIMRGTGRAGFNFQIGNQGPKIMHKYFYEYPFLRWNREILEGHEVTHILAEKSSLAKFYSLSETNLDCFKVLAENDEFIIYRYHPVFELQL